MAYEFPVIEFGLYEPDADLMVRCYGLPDWWHKYMIITLSIIKRTHQTTTTNYILANWIESYLPIVSSPDSNGTSRVYYEYYKNSYTADKLETLLHTFPFSKEFIYKLLDTTIEKERPDLTIVIEKFIEEQDYYEGKTSDRFEL